MALAFSMQAEISTTTRDENIQVGNKQIIRRIFAYYLPEHLPPPDIDVGRHI